MIVPTNRGNRSWRIALGRPQLSRLSLSNSTFAHSFPVHSIFPWVMVMPLVGSSVIVNAESYFPSVVGRRRRIKSIVIVWTGSDEDQIGCSDP